MTHSNIKDREEGVHSRSSKLQEEERESVQKPERRGESGQLGKMLLKSPLKNGKRNMSIGVGRRDITGVLMSSGRDTDHIAAS